MKQAQYKPALGKLHATITQDGKILCIFKKAPSDEQGHAMAAALSSCALHPTAKHDDREQRNDQ